MCQRNCAKFSLDELGMTITRSFSVAGSPTFLSKCPLMMTWLAVTRSLQLDIANLVLVQALLFRSHTWGNNFRTGWNHNHNLLCTQSSYLQGPVVAATDHACGVPHELGAEHLAGVACKNICYLRLKIFALPTCKRVPQPGVLHGPDPCGEVITGTQNHTAYNSTM